MERTGSVWVITGASSGIGRRTALDVASQGARVCASARREDRLRRLVDEMGGPERGHSWVQSDVSRRDDVRRLARHVDDTYGRCDVLLNNAGFSTTARFDGPDAIDDVERVIGTNFIGMVYCTGELLALLKRSAPSYVVNLASMAGRLAVGPPAYVASKFAAVGWTEALHAELAPQGIHVCSVEPGLIPTEGFPQSHAMRDPLLRFTLGRVEDVSRAIQGAVDGRKVQRVVPRWYYLLQLPRLFAPPAFRFFERKLVGTRAERRAGL